MGDVVGALPSYLPEHDVLASVVIPKYDNNWFRSHKFKTIWDSSFKMGHELINFSVLQLKGKSLKFPFYAIDIPGKFDRPHIYLTEEGTAYDDEIERNISFQTAVLEWVNEDPEAWDLLHCHDHMTGLIPFMMQNSFRFKSLVNKPCFFTIHNGQYRGIFDWTKGALLPEYEQVRSGLLDWDGMINSLAVAIKCSWRVNTVSPNYMEELKAHFDTLTSLMRFEAYKSLGLLNGIDSELWDPRSDVMIAQLMKRSPQPFKTKNKNYLAKQFKFSSARILVSFIGRFAYEKGADLLAESISTFLQNNDKVHFFILGSGDKEIEQDILKLQDEHPTNVTAVIAYNEKLAHQIYASSDFIVMPSRFEPCGLNQLYALRYGTVPVVRHTGGLKDTVPDIGDGGVGISFLNADVRDIVYSFERVVELYEDKKNMEELRKTIMKLDYSWSKSAGDYAEQYQITIN